MAEGAPWLSPGVFARLKEDQWGPLPCAATGPTVMPSAHHPYPRLWKPIISTPNYWMGRSVCAGARVIVNSSKRPAIGTLPSPTGGVSLRRPPRKGSAAVAYSYKRTRKTVDREMKREGSVEVTLTPNHTAGGNLSRFETRRIARLDKEWVARQKPGDRRPPPPCLCRFSRATVTRSSRTSSGRPSFQDRQPSEVVRV